MLFGIILRFRRENCRSFPYVMILLQKILAFGTGHHLIGEKHAGLLGVLETMI